MDALVHIPTVAPLALRFIQGVLPENTCDFSAFLDTFSDSKPVSPLVSVLAQPSTLRFSQSIAGGFDFVVC